MDLSTQYLGLTLPHPLICGASPLVDDLDAARRVEDAGAAAIVMHSLFEEQIQLEMSASSQVEQHHDAFAEAQSFFPNPGELHLGPRAYLSQLQRLKRTLRIPVIASLNGTTASGWTRYARAIEEAGADALELNIYLLATDPEVDGARVDERVIEVASAVREAVALPLAVKLSPFFSSLPNLIRRLDEVGVTAAVLFNRFYQPDIDIEQLEVAPKLVLSNSSDLLLRLRWIAILYGRTRLQLAATGGVHTVEDAVKALMAGATAVQTVSSLLQRGPEHMASLIDGLTCWLTEREYRSLAQLRGSMSLSRCPDPAAFERGNYARVLNTWRSER